ncbi:MAG: hypothetical protein IJD20_01655 [Oscillospiraceae bacterium]|nr:hypothetical protein [Oscillospiraceae bacterium]
MNIIGEIVWHGAWGKGEILTLESGIVNVRFDIGDKKLQFPEGFEKFLTFENEKLQAQALELLERKREEAARLEQERESEQERIKFEKEKRMPSAIKVKKKREKANIAFKCNFCDGGCSADNIGYKGVCSDEMIDYNIEVAHHSWCSDRASPCFRYHNGDITREALENSMAGGVVDGGFVCYESQMLTKWKAFAGYALTKENYQKPMTLSKVQTHSLCVLTTRLPDSNEQDRFVFAVFLVDETFEGDNRSEGYVTTSSKFRLSFTREEARKLKFWNYYVNRNKPENISWGQGLHRYMDDIQALQLLRDIADLKKDTKDEALAAEFYNYFLQISGFERENIPENNGALGRKQGV